MLHLRRPLPGPCLRIQHRLSQLSLLIVSLDTCDYALERRTCADDGSAPSGHLVRMRAAVHPVERRAIYQGHVATVSHDGLLLFSSLYWGPVAIFLTQRSLLDCVLRARETNTLVLLSQHPIATPKDHHDTYNPSPTPCSGVAHGQLALIPGAILRRPVPRSRGIPVAAAVSQSHGARMIATQMMDGKWWCLFQAHGCCVPCCGGVG
jgi:hypothetical protein